MSQFTKCVDFSIFPLGKTIDFSGLMKRHYAHVPNLNVPHGKEPQGFLPLFAEKLLTTNKSLKDCVRKGFTCWARGPPGPEEGRMGEG